VAWLLGCRAGSKVSRYERFARTPSLLTVFAYEIIFRTPARDLFAGTFEAASLSTLKRTRELITRLKRRPSNRLISAQLATLEAIRPPRPRRAHRT
jgi:hypothetical protein